MTATAVPNEVYRYEPPRQPIARAQTFIGDVLLDFSLTFTGSLDVLCAVASPSQASASRSGAQVAGATLHRIADGLFISAVKADRPMIESEGGHRFVHVDSSSPLSHTRRFHGQCHIDIPGGSRSDEPAIRGSLDYVLDVRAAAPSDPPRGGSEGPKWSERDDHTLAAIGAIVLAPVPVSAQRAARLFAVGDATG